MAVVYGCRSELRRRNQRANQLAHHLDGLGVSPRTVWPSASSAAWRWSVGLLAVLKCGGAYVPLDPAYAAARLSYMIEDSAPRGAAH